MNNIAVLGFGRSGTTWVMDIIAKTTGRLLLFEPLHPCVTELSEKYAYSEVVDVEDSRILKRYFKDILNKQHKNKWLLRNTAHLPLDHITENFLDMLWHECTVIGFKCIRGNFMIDWFQRELDSKIVYVVRHPCAVVASIMRRKNFWEFGWPGTYEMFLSKTVYNRSFKSYKFSNISSILQRAKDDIDKYAVMWSVTQLISFVKLDELGLPRFYYEDFYRNPFSSSRALLSYLGYNTIDVHPAHIFTPSMTTLKTVHGSPEKEKDIEEKGPAAFWADTLSEKEVERILDIVHSFNIKAYDEFGNPLAT